MARRVNGNGWNFSRSVDGILEILGEDSLFDIISEFNIVKELKPENAIKTEFGYKTNKNIKRLDSSEKTQDNIIAQFLLKNLLSVGEEEIKYWSIT